MLSSLGRVLPRVPRLKQTRPRCLYHSRALAKTWQQTLSSVSVLRSIYPASRTSGIPQRVLSTAATAHENPVTSIEELLPVCCPGCGAYSQIVEPNEPGYYGRLGKGKQTRKPLSEVEAKPDGENATALKADGERAADTIQRIVRDQRDTQKPDPRNKALLEEATATANRYLEKSRPTVHICDRCHDLVHHNKAVPAVSPSLETLRDFLDESPHKHNRVYHVVDAADFPMSLVDNIHEVLGVKDQRSQNRRAASYKYKRGKLLPTISFVITRSDLLGATKEQVDSKMQYMRTMIREILDMPSDDYRLGNLHMISAQRGWWNKQVKDEIREHGGGIWVIGKANVGKSSFIEACFPKDSKNLEKIAELVERRGMDSRIPNSPDPLDSDGLLPPVPREDLFPVLPVVSSLSGTTVSPIRIPFGRGRGEMIDLPGLDRSELAEHVRDEYKRDLIMTKRKKPERHSVKPGQSLLLGGGLVRITSTHPDHTVMAACFVPMEVHITKTEKAIEMQAQQRAYPGTVIANDGIGETISSAGVFDVKHDVTKSHLPTTLAKAIEDKRTRMPSLPYRVFSTDILIEGCGWVELTVQTRAKRSDKDGAESSESTPQVEVFTPYGRHIGARAPIECWNLIAQKQAADKRKIGARRRQNVGQLKRAHQSANAKV
ncbi:uncharacterized protein BDW47DRAFT_134296 [Aspergillus candidus]|uniref:G domain-containing protein n=1 Tax=Aspergillus candidus TaxID=41067 RepID=A0A2I2F1R8_ASPCN|nr:hypothetical protein BDW47DRAFT_134296 [Aspergillus candidus]PLB34548.1 hypothetical protein BDW47DRAFT_134296 [Aspergillus candidus]